MEAMWKRKCKCKISTNIDERCNVNSENWYRCRMKLETVLHHLLKENVWKDSIEFRGIEDTFKNPHISHTIKERFHLKPREYKQLIDLFNNQ